MVKFILVLLLSLAYAEEDPIVTEGEKWVPSVATDSWRNAIYTGFQRRVGDSREYGVIVTLLSWTKEPLVINIDGPIVCDRDFRLGTYIECRTPHSVILDVPHINYLGRGIGPYNYIRLLFTTRLTGKEQ